MTLETELIPEENEEKEESLQPSPDLQRTLAQYVYRKIDGLDDFQQRGTDLIEYTRHGFVTLGALLMKGWVELRPHVRWEDGSEIENITAWERYCAKLWGCNSKSLTKARSVAMTYALAEPPEDASPTLLYEVRAGLTNDEDLDDALQAVTEQGLNSYEVRVLKALRKKKLVKGWQLPTMRWDGPNLIASDGEVEALIATRTTSQLTLAQAGLYMMERGLAVEKEIVTNSPARKPRDSSVGRHID